MDLDILGSGVGCVSLDILGGRVRNEWIWIY